MTTPKKKKKKLTKLRKKTKKKKTEISDVPHKEFKVTVIKMLSELGRRMNGSSDNIRKR